MEGSLRDIGWTDSFLAPPENDVRRGSTPSFSVLIGAYQAADTIADAVASALEQTVAPAEIIVCDDGSTDDLEGALAPYRDRLVVVQKPNGGGASALNRAASEARGDFVAILDADDAFLPRRLEALGELVRTRPDLDVVATDAVFEVGLRPVGRFNQANPFPIHDQRLVVLERCFVFAPAIRRDRLLAAGGYDESISIAYDWDCLLRLVLDDCRVGLVDEPLVRYRIRDGSLASNRVAALHDRVVVLEKASAAGTVRAEERPALERALARHRQRFALAEARAAVRGDDQDARRLLLAVALGSGFSLRSRLAAFAAAVSPASARIVLDRRERRTGHSPLRRPLLDLAGRDGTGKRTESGPEPGRRLRRKV